MKKIHFVCSLVILVLIFTACDEIEKTGKAGEPSTSTKYTVKKGDYSWSVAGGDIKEWDKMKKLNPDLNWKKLEKGKAINIPLTSIPQTFPSPEESASASASPSVSPSVSPSASPSVSPSASPSPSPSASPGCPSISGKCEGWYTFVRSTDDIDYPLSAKVAGKTVDLGGNANPNKNTQTISYSGLYFGFIARDEVGVNLDYSLGSYTTTTVIVRWKDFWGTNWYRCKFNGHLQSGTEVQLTQIESESDYTKLDGTTTFKLLTGSDGKSRPCPEFKCEKDSDCPGDCNICEIKSGETKGLCRELSTKEANEKKLLGEC